MWNLQGKMIRGFEHNYKAQINFLTMNTMPYFIYHPEHDQRSQSIPPQTIKIEKLCFEGEQIPERSSDFFSSSSAGIGGLNRLYCEMSTWTMIPFWMTTCGSTWYITSRFTHVWTKMAIFVDVIDRIQNLWQKCHRIHWRICCRVPDARRLIQSCN